ncbi:MAG: class I SAM-dependent methyltransferase [Candidatus Moranbacteria bacterium]|jgi:2-polyprenyl-3-methyl-5-hydroxy-6-metoxy-1,4-benzoquinol methylase|nr:class I SAM-dependent methyltransferase [Candidatus Moranbacteria bacterium]
MRLKPKTILELGPGNNIVTNILKTMNYDVKTLDFDNSTKPDYNLSITDEKIDSIGTFDLIIASQVLEHIQYKDFTKALKNLSKISTNLILTLPHTTINSFTISLSLKIPTLKKITFSKKFFYKKVNHKFNGLHYWEIGKKDFPVKKISSDIQKSGWIIQAEFLNDENPFHYFFILKKTYV